MNSIEEINGKWELFLEKLQSQIGKKPDLNGILFLIGVQELGTGRKDYTKEQKQDLMHIAICKVLSLSGFYELDGIDQDGWPHWKMIKKLPYVDLLSQEIVLKEHILLYFETEIWKERSE